MSINQQQEQVFKVTREEIVFACQILGYTRKELEDIVREGKPLQVRWTAARRLGRQTALDVVQRWRDQLGIQVNQTSMARQRTVGSLKDDMARASSR